MIKQGVLDNPKPDAIFALHVLARLETGKIAYRPGPTMASADTLKIIVRGQQAHGAMPWQGVDPIVVASQIILALQTIESRQVNNQSGGCRQCTGGRENHRIRGFLLLSTAHSWVLFLYRHYPSGDGC